MLPKNIRQIGQIEGNKRIYIEDYVMTYARKIEGMAVLLGKQEEEGEEHIFYISGAVGVKNVAYGYPTTLNNEDWSAIYENVKNHFADLEIMGWLLVRKDVVLEIDEEIRRIHEENFKGKNKILFLYDKGENDESFYLANSLGDLKKQTGYYIFYEKNKAMQNYMIEMNPTEKVEEEVKDNAMVKVREIIAQKEPLKNEKRMMNLMYGASTLLAAVVLVIGATMLDNYDKMKNMEKTLNVISSNLNEEKTEVDKVVEVEKIDGNTEQIKTDLNKDAAIAEDTNAAKDAAQDSEVAKEDTNKEDEVKEADETKEAQETKETDETKEAQEKAEVEDKTSEEAAGKATPKDTAKQEVESEAKPASASVAKEYVVKEGDTLASISYKLYQTYTYVDKIQELNKIDDSDIIFAGQKLQLP